jgi:hypothetical protein
MGLGLAAVRGTVSLLGGEISVLSPPSDGVELVITLPVRRESQRSALPSSRSTVLLAEDDASIRESASRVLALCSIASVQSTPHCRSSCPRSIPGASSSRRRGPAPRRFSPSRTSPASLCDARGAFLAARGRKAAQWRRARALAVPAPSRRWDLTGTSRCPEGRHKFLYPSPFRRYPP